MPGIESLRSSLFIPSPRERPAQFAEILARRHLERELGATLGARLPERDGQEADLAGEVGPVLLARRQHEAHGLRIVCDGLFEVRRLEGRVADASGSDHGVFPDEMNGRACPGRSAAPLGGALQTRDRSRLWRLERSRISGAPLRKSFALHRIRDKPGSIVPQGLDKRKLFGESFCGNYGNLKEQTWRAPNRRATSLRPINPPTARAPALWWTTRSSTPPS